ETPYPSSVAGAAPAFRHPGRGPGAPRARPGRRRRQARPARAHQRVDRRRAGGGPGRDRCRRNVLHRAPRDGAGAPAGGAHGIRGHRHTAGAGGALRDAGRRRAGGGGGAADRAADRRGAHPAAAAAVAGDVGLLQPRGPGDRTVPEARGDRAPLQHEPRPGDRPDSGNHADRPGDRVRPLVHHGSHPAHPEGPGYPLPAAGVPGRHADGVRPVRPERLHRARAPGSRGGVHGRVADSHRVQRQRSGVRRDPAVEPQGTL
ncbi:MAG: hypothetical protein AVDCRST_MAG89-3346, partial [uncultured Gemmatimonadetes bacterium]